ncbi:TNT domain-containing protein [Mycobacterium kyorinense]|nr:TNT domain-containing protein [Mycobacterium kyorinense]
MELSAQNAFRVWAGAGHAYQEAAAVKKELADLFNEAAAAPAVHIDAASNSVIPPDTTGMADQDVQKIKAKVDELQRKITALLATAEKTNTDLAAVLKAATGTQEPDPAADPPVGKPRTWQDMLLPPGPGGATPADPTTPASPTGKPPTLEDLMLGRGQPADQQPPGSLPDLLSRLRQPGPPGTPAPQITPADAERFKAMARQSMALEGVPPDQIEARLDAIVARTQQWIDNGMPNYVAPEPQRPPPPGFGEGFGDRWFATEQGIKNLIGQGGPGAPGVLESWEQMLKGTAEIAQNPVGAAAGEIKNAFDSPSAAYYLGAKASDGAFALPGLMFGGEGAAVEAGLPAEIVTERGAPLAVVRGWEPTGGMPWDDFASHFGTPETRSYPLNDGFPPGHVPQPAQLPEGTIIDRFGSEYGRYLAPDGTPFTDRALAPESVGADYNRYMVTGKPLPLSVPVES